MTMFTVPFISVKQTPRCMGANEGAHTSRPLSGILYLGILQPHFQA